MERKWWTLIAVCVGTFMLLLDVTIVNVALPDIQSSLKASFSDLQWVVDAYALTLAALLLTAGSVADLYGRRILFSVGLSLFTLGSLLCGVATSPLFLILARGGQGIGGAIMFATSLALLAQAFSGRERGVAFGAWGTTTGVAVALGPVLGGVITSGLSWRWIFLVNVPIGVVGVILTLTRVSESRDPEASRLDVPGFVLFSGALAALVYGLIEAGLKSWTYGAVIGCFVGSAVLLVGFLVAELRSGHPMLDLSLFRKPTFAGGSIAAFCLSSSLFALLLYIVLYLQDQLGLSALQAGLRLLLLSGGILITATIAGRLSSRVPVRLLIGPGLVLVGVGLILMGRITDTSTWTHLIAGFIIAGLGVGMINPPLASTAVGVVQPRQAGMASGINSTFRQVGIATGIAALGSIFGNKVSETITAGLRGSQALAGHTAQIVSAVKNGATGQALATLPAGERATVAHVARTAFVRGLNDILLIGGIVALAGAACSFTLIRQRDFAASPQHRPDPSDAGPATPPATQAAAAGT